MWRVVARLTAKNKFNHKYTCSEPQIKVIISDKIFAWRPAGNRHESGSGTKSGDKTEKGSTNKPVYG